MKTSHLFLLFSSLLFLNLTNAQDITVSNIAEYNAALPKVNAGGTIIIKNCMFDDSGFP